MQNHQSKLSLFLLPGKSSLAIQFVQGQFIDHYEPTIENGEKTKIAIDVLEGVTHPMRD